MNDAETVMQEGHITEMSPTAWSTEPVYDYPYSQFDSSDRGRTWLLPVAAVLATLLLALLLLGGVLLMHMRNTQDKSMPATVTQEETVTVPPSALGDDYFIDRMHEQGYPVADRNIMVGIGHHLCYLLGNGDSIDSVVNFMDNDNPPEGWNRAAAIAMIWAAEDAYCPGLPR